MVIVRCFYHHPDSYRDPQGGLNFDFFRSPAYRQAGLGVGVNEENQLTE
jgi:hypothetical protein